MVGSSVWRGLQLKGYRNLLGHPSKILDLRSQAEVSKFFRKEKPEHVLIAAAKVGGIYANNRYRAEFIYDNLQIQNNLIHFSYLSNVKTLLFLGSSCIYPRNCPQPIKEEYLLTGGLEYTNEPYAIAKIAGIKMCESYNNQYKTKYISVMPTNLYGPNDNYDLMNSHVLPALIRKILLGKYLEENNWNMIKLDMNKNPIDEINGKKSKKIIIEVLKKNGILFSYNHSTNIIDCNSVKVFLWGTGSPLREFLHVDDLADACIFLMEKVSKKNLKLTKSNNINIGTGDEISIKELASLIKKTVGFNGSLIFDKSNNDGTPRKLLNCDRINSLGWKSKINLSDGINRTIKDYQNGLNE